MEKPSARARGRSRRGGLGKYLRARGRRGGGRPADFRSKPLEEEQEDQSSENEEDDSKYAKRQIGTNAHRYEEPEVDPNVEEEEVPEVDLSSFLERQRLATENDDLPHREDEDGVDHTLSNLPSTSSRIVNARKNKTQKIEWDASMDELKREKEAAEAVWDLKSRFRKNQPRLIASHNTALRRKEKTSTKVEDARHIHEPADPDMRNLNPDATPESRANMEEFLDNLLT